VGGGTTKGIKSGCRRHPPQTLPACPTTPHLLQGAQGGQAEGRLVAQQHQAGQTRCRAGGSSHGAQGCVVKLVAAQVQDLPWGEGGGGGRAGGEGGTAGKDGSEAVQQAYVQKLWG
jgi:hypothetical protein